MNEIYNGGISPIEACNIQASIFAWSPLIAKAHSNVAIFQSNIPTGFNHRYKDGFSPDFRIFQDIVYMPTLI